MGDINIPFSPTAFDKLYTKVITYLNDKELYVRDSYVCADPKYRVNIRVVNEYPWSNFFAYNMFMRPSASELEDFIPEWTIVNAPSFMAIPKEDGTRQHNFAILNFTKKIALIGGTGYTGEIKKGIFSALNFILPVYKNTLPMHCSANVGKNDETPYFLDSLVQEKPHYLQIQNVNSLAMMSMAGRPKTLYLILKEVVMPRSSTCQKSKEPDIYNAIKKGQFWRMS